ncbi:hypothetical protein SAMN06297251_102140 [Fulvimarina manganoxydans]|uniref:Uncharacterized protein n=1 Tax=Fulvimarina manganoxydans TaxID=937218 RepID=A0A1W1Z3X3_9HYPH|nr:hypothetical protein [Fulvimarina manganoxydans]SMC43170.1 hypothetical protein SAMN06297251_102140 [Fulvimarina manganoxydans]
MDRAVNVRPNQQMTAGDGQNIQEFLRAGIARLIQDAFGSTGYYSGFQISRRDVWEIQFTEGRLYVSGQAYSERSPAPINLYNQRPLEGQRKIATIVARGEPVDSDDQPRKFLKDVNTRETQVNTVSMLKTWTVFLEAIVGPPAAQPVAPAAPAGYVKIGEVELTSGGIPSTDGIRMSLETELPNVTDILMSVDVLEDWREQTEVSVGRLRTDLFALSRSLENYASLALLQEVLQRLSATEKTANDALALASDEPFLLDFIEEFASEEASDTGYAGYSARIKDGRLRFPRTEGNIQGGIQLANAIDPKVDKVGDVITPKSSARTVIDNSGSLGPSVRLQSYTIAEQPVSYTPPSSPSGYQAPVVNQPTKTVAQTQEPAKTWLPSTQSLSQVQASLGSGYTVTVKSPPNQFGVASYYVVKK